MPGHSLNVRGMRASGLWLLQEASMYFNQFSYDMAEPDDDSAFDEAMEAEGLDPGSPEDRAEFAAAIKADRADAAIYQWEMSQ